jgi:hypothetical protein
MELLSMDSRKIAPVSVITSSLDVSVLSSELVSVLLCSVAEATLSVVVSSVDELPQPERAVAVIAAVRSNARTFLFIKPSY